MAEHADAAERLDEPDTGPGIRIPIAVVLVIVAVLAAGLVARIGVLGRRAAAAAAPPGPAPVPAAVTPEGRA